MKAHHFLGNFNLVKKILIVKKNISFTSGFYS